MIGLYKIKYVNKQNIYKFFKFIPIITLKTLGYKTPIYYSQLSSTRIQIKHLPTVIINPTLILTPLTSLQTTHLTYIHPNIDLMLDRRKQYKLYD